MLNIGQAAAASGISAKMIRHYEDIGLLPAVVRTEAGYRQYSDRDVQTLCFIRHSRDLGFSLQETGKLLSLWFDRSRPSREVKALAEQHVHALERKALELLAMKAALTRLIDGCRGDDRPQCPIIEGLANGVSRPRDEQGRDRAHEASTERGQSVR